MDIFDSARISSPTDLVDANVRIGITPVDQSDTSNFPLLFVCPLVNSDGQAGVLSYVTVDDLFMIGSVPEGSVIMVDDGQLEIFRLFCQNAPLFERSVSVLWAVPGVEYSPGFLSATVGVTRTSFHGLVSELELDREVSAAKAAAATDQSVFLSERSRVERRDGSVRSAAVGVAGLVSDEELDDE